MSFVPYLQNAFLQKLSTLLNICKRYFVKAFINHSFQVFFTLLFLLLFHTNTYAQKFQVKGSVRDENDSVVYSTIQLKDVKNNLIAGVFTDRNGKFELNTISRNSYFLVVSSIGFISDTTLINNLSKNLDVGVIYLKPTATTLGAVTITAKSVFSKDGIRYVVPPSGLVKTSSNGLMLLEKMNLPRLRVDAVSNTILVSGGGQVQLRINGREVTAQDISALQCDEIIRIEYHDKPEARYNYAAAVLDYIVKHRESGGYIFTELWNGLLTPFGEDRIVAKMNRKKSELSASYNLQYRNWNHLWRTNNETFQLADKTITRYEDGKPAGFEYYNHRANLGYNYQEENNMLNISFTTLVKNQVHKDWKSDLYSNFSTAPVSMSDSSQNMLINPSLNIYYQHALTKNETLIFNLFGLINSGSYNRYYNETYQGRVLTGLTSAIDEDQYSGGISFLYENKLKAGTLNIGLNEKSVSTRDSYKNKVDSSDLFNKSALDVHVIYLYAQFGRQLNKWYYRAGIGTNMSIQAVNNTVNNYLFFRPSFTLTYSPKEDVEINYTGSVYPTSPDLAALTDYDQRIDSLQIQRGNPALKPQTNYYNAFSIDYNFKKTGVSYYLNHTYTALPLMENSFLENDVIVRTIENHKSFQTFNTELEFRAKPYKDYFTVQLYSGINHYISNGNTYNHTETIYYIGGKVKINYKKLTLSWLVSQNTSDSYWGETLMRDESAHVVSLSYNTQTYYVGLECFNMFSTKHVGSRENFNSVAPYTRFEYLDELRNMIRFKINYTFRYGKEYNAGNKKIRNSEDVESGIQKGEK